MRPPSAYSDPRYLVVVFRAANLLPVSDGRQPLDIGLPPRRPIEIEPSDRASCVRRSDTPWTMRPAPANFPKASRVKRSAFLSHPLPPEPFFELADRKYNQPIVESAYRLAAVPAPPHVAKAL